MTEKVHQYAYKDANDFVTLLHKAQSNGQRVRLGEAANVLEVIDKPQGFPARIVSWLRDLSGAHLKEEEEVADRLQHLVDQALPMSLESSTLLEKNPQRVKTLLYSHEDAPAILAKEMGIDEAKAQEIVDQRMQKLYGSGLALSKEVVLPVVDAHFEWTQIRPQKDHADLVAQFHRVSNFPVDANGISMAFIEDLPRSTCVIRREDLPGCPEVKGVSPDEFKASLLALGAEKKEYPALITQATQLMHQGMIMSVNEGFATEFSNRMGSEANDKGLTLMGSPDSKYELVVEAGGDIRIDISDWTHVSALGTGGSILSMIASEKPEDLNGSSRAIRFSVRLQADDLRQGRMNPLLDGEPRCELRLKVDWQNTM